jgi:hypothetical protein
MSAPMPKWKRGYVGLLIFFPMAIGFAVGMLVAPTWFGFRAAIAGFDRWMQNNWPNPDDRRKRP